MARLEILRSLSCLGWVSGVFADHWDVRRQAFKVLLVLGSVEILLFRTIEVSLSVLMRRGLLILPAQKLRL